MAKNYVLARHLVALEGGWVDLAHSLKDNFGGPRIQKHLDDRVEHYAKLFATPDKNEHAKPADQTQAYLNHQAYQRTRAIELAFIKSFSPGMSNQSLVGLVQRHYRDLGKNYDAMVRVPGGRLDARTCADLDLRNLRHACEKIAGEAKRYETLYRSRERLVDRMLDLFAEREQYAGTLHHANVDEDIHKILSDLDIDTRIILTRVFGKELMGGHARKARRKACGTSG